MYRGEPHSVSATDPCSIIRAKPKSVIFRTGFSLQKALGYRVCCTECTNLCQRPANSAALGRDAVSSCYVESGAHALYRERLLIKRWHTQLAQEKLCSLLSQSTIRLLVEVLRKITPCTAFNCIDKQPRVPSQYSSMMYMYRSTPLPK